MTGTYIIRGPWEVGTNLVLTGNRVDASGGGSVGPGTVGYVSFFTGTNAIGDSSIKDTGTASTGVVLTLGTLTTPDQPGTYGRGVNLLIQPGAAGSLGGYGGYLYLNGGAGGGYGGDVRITGGAAATAGTGGRIQIGGGNGAGTAGVGGSVTIQAGQATGTATAPQVIINGALNTGSGPGGKIEILGGQSLGGDAGDIEIGTFVAGSTAGVNGNVNVSSEGDISLSSNGNVTITVNGGAAQQLLIFGLPTSAAGLPSGAIWLNSNVLTRVP